MRRVFVFLLSLVLCAVCLAPAMADSGGLAFLAAPSVLRPGKVYDFTIEAPAAGNLSLSLVYPTGQPAYDIFVDYPASAGQVDLHWDGLRADYSVMEAGEYILQMRLGTELVVAPLRVGAPYPLITHVQQSDFTLAEEPIQISFDASEDGSLSVDLRKNGEAATRPLTTLPAKTGPNSFSWDGKLDGARLPDGSYSLLMTLKVENGTESMPNLIPVEIGSAAPAVEEALVVQTTQVEENDAPQEDTLPAQAESAEDGEPAATLNQDDASAEESTEEETAEPTEAPTASGQPSPPYSATSDGSFWAMSPGETDDAVIWDILMQPITVYDGGMDQRDHVYLMENEDGSGKKIAQIHAQSQGIHVLGEPNQHGYVLAETFSSYDDKYFPTTSEEKEHAFELKQGYIKASGLKTVKVKTDIGIVVDKKTQRLYIYRNGERATELLVSTGLLINDDYYRETPPGEFITVSHVGPFSTHRYMKSEMAIRISGGILIHEVPYEPLGDGSRRYTNYESKLGGKASAGCIRVQRLENEDGYNQKWLWEHLERGAPYKVIIWDDVNRTDTPTTKYPNPSS